MGKPQLLTSAQLAEAYGVSIRTIGRWISQGRLTPISKLPGRTGAYLFSQDSLPRKRAA